MVSQSKERFFCSLEASEQTAEHTPRVDEIGTERNLNQIGYTLATYL